MAGPLAGQRVLVPRAVAQAPALSARIEALGGTAVEAPVLVVEPGDLEALAQAVRRLATTGVALTGLTSPNGVDALADALERAGHDARVLAGAGRIACVGAGTAARLWDRLRVRPDLLPDRATTRALGEALPPGEGVALLPRAEQANPQLVALVAARGYSPLEVVAYRTTCPPSLPPEVVDGLVRGGIDQVAVASPSTARHLVALCGTADWAARVVSIGPVTSAACRELDLEVAAEADPHDLDGLVAALAASGP